MGHPRRATVAGAMGGMGGHCQLCSWPHLPYAGWVPRLALLALLSFATEQMLGQPGTVTTIAGQFPLGDGGPAMEAAFYGPGGLARDSKGNVYVLETNRLRRISRMAW